MLILPVFVVLSSFGFQESFADEKTWYVGEGLKPGDYFSYQICHIDYKECSNFQMDFWIQDEIIVGVEEKWLAIVVVYDGTKIIKGSMELGKITPEPTYGSSEISTYRNVFKTSLVWFSVFTTAYSPLSLDLGTSWIDRFWVAIGTIRPQIGTSLVFSPLKKASSLVLVSLN